MGAVAQRPGTVGTRTYDPSTNLARRKKRGTQITRNLPQTVWDRLHPEAISTSNAITYPASAKKDWSKFWKTVTLLDILAATLWSYALLKIFVFDPDIALVNAIAPDHPWIVNLRLVVFIGLALFLALRGRKKSILWFIYIAFWPLAWLGWRLPRTIHKHQAWTFVLAIAQAAIAIFYGLIPTLVIAAVAIVGAFMCAAGTGTVSLIGTGVTAIAWCAVFGLIFSSALKPSHFFRVQEKIIAKLSMERPKDPKTASQQGQSRRNRRRQGRLSKTESEKFVNAAVFQLFAQKAIFMWAAKLNDYRRSLVTFLYPPLSTLGLFIITGLLLGLANLGLYHFNDLQFSVDSTIESPSFLNFLYYTIVGLYSGEIDGIAPRSDLAVGLKLGLSIVGPMIVLSLFAAVFQNYRVLRDAKVADKVVAELRGYARKLESKFQKEYHLSPSQAIAKLRDMGAGVSVILLSMTAAAANQEGGEER